MDNETQVQQDDKRALRVKQGMIWGVSFAIALAISFALLPLMKTDLATYSIKYFILTVIPIAMVFVIWGDYLLGAEILPD